MKGLTTYTASPSSPEDLTGGLRACSNGALSREDKERLSVTSAHGNAASLAMFVMI
jgi:hypothetical protein